MPGWWRQQQQCPGRTHILQGQRRGPLPGPWGCHPLHGQQEFQPVAPGPLACSRMAAWWLLLHTVSALPRPLLVLGMPGPHPQGKAVQQLGRLGKLVPLVYCTLAFLGHFLIWKMQTNTQGIHSPGSRCMKTENAQPGAAVAGTAVALEECPVLPCGFVHCFKYWGLNPGPPNH